MSSLENFNCRYTLAILAFPAAHQRRRRTSDPLERVNRELKCRTRVAGLFPNVAFMLRLVSALLADQHQENNLAAVRILPKRFAELERNQPYVAFIGITPIAKG